MPFFQASHMLLGLIAQSMSFVGSYLTVAPKSALCSLIQYTTLRPLVPRSRRTIDITCSQQRLRVAFRYSIVYKSLEIRSSTSIHSWGWLIILLSESTAKIHAPMVLIRREETTLQTRNRSACITVREGWAPSEHLQQEKATSMAIGMNKEGTA
jgi:hypothetical protein